MNKKLLTTFPDTLISNYIVAKETCTGTILDIGGKGRIQKILGRIVVDANITKGLDGRDLPFDNDSFDNVVSVNVLEHVPANDRIKVLREALRVTRNYVIMTFPFDGIANITESLKRSIGHKHPIANNKLPCLKELTNWLESTKHSYTIDYCMPSYLHLLSICGKTKLTPAIKVFMNKLLLEHPFLWYCDKGVAHNVLFKLYKNRERAI